MMSVSLGELEIAVLSAGNGTMGTLAPLSNCFWTRERMVGFTSVSKSSDARRSLTTFFKVG